MDTILLHLVFIAMPLLIGIALVLRARLRTSTDVLSDLSDDQAGIVREGGETKEIRLPRFRFILNDELSTLGLFEEAERRSYMLKQKLLPLVFVSLLLTFRLLFAPTNFSGLMVTLIIGLASAYLYTRFQHAKRKEAFKRQVEYFLPLIMERMVMGVQAGLDILPAINVILGLQEAPEHRSKDPVSRLLFVVYQLTESGLRFEQALHDVADMVQIPAIRHAFVHLAVAQKQGGELIMPLRELSDSTQAFFQESVEEQIAKLPVKATAPLLCTFVGLMLLFATAPMIQVLGILQKASSFGEGEK